MSHNRVLCVAEKPTVAKSIANILYRPQTAQSLRTHSIYNPKYEFQCFFEGRNVTMVVTSVTGHLMESDFDDRHRKWHSCDPRALMDLSTPVCRRVPQDKSPLKDTLEEEARKCGTLVCCLDGDREGENISYEVLPASPHAPVAPQTPASHQNLTIARQTWGDCQQRPWLASLRLSPPTSASAGSRSHGIVCTGGCSRQSPPGQEDISLSVRGPFCAASEARWQLLTRAHPVAGD